MKPIKLEIYNIGPFTGTNTINFSELGEFFLISGQTGAGKSTIFDCIFYSLYGAIPGAKRKVDLNLLKSQFANPEDKCYVTFTFKINNKEYRIHREPAWIKKSSRTGNDRKIDETVLLEELNGTEIKASYTKQNEIKEKIQKIIGLSPDEFSSIILLPQGQFADFLQKSTTEKQEILEKLFPVDDYKNISKKIAEQSKGKAEKLNILEEQLKHLQNDFNIDTFNSEKEELENKIEKANEQFIKINTQKNIIEKQLNQLETKENLESQLKTELAKKEKLSEQEEEITSLKNRLKKIPIAREIKTYYDNKNICKDKLTKSNANKERLDLQIKELKLEKKELESQQKEQEDKKNLVKKIENQLPLLREAAKEKDKIDTLKKDIESLDKKISENKKKQKDITDFIEETTCRKKSNAKIIETIPQLIEEKNSLQYDKQKAIDINKLLSQIKATEEKISSLSNDILKKNDEKNSQETSLKVFETKLAEAKQKEKEEQDLEKASVLSATLQENKPCPVCGSLLHPFPAKPFHSEFSLQDEIKSFEQAIETNRNNLNNTTNNLTIFETKKTELNNTLVDTKEKLAETSKNFSEYITKEFSADLSNTNNFTINVINTLNDFINKKQENVNKQLNTANNLKQENSEFEKLLNQKEIEQKETEQEISKDNENLYNKKITLAPLEEKYNKAGFLNEQKTPQEQIEEQENQKNKLQKEIDNYETKKNYVNESISKATGSIITEEEVLKTAKNEFEKSNETLNKSVLGVSKEFDIPTEENFINSDNYNNSILKIIEYAISISEETAIKEKISNYESMKNKNDTLITNLNKQIKEIPLLQNREDLESVKATTENEYKNIQDDLVTNKTQLNKLNDNKKSFDSLNKERQEQSTDLSTLAQLSKDLNGENIKNKNFTAWILGIYLEEITKYATQRLIKMSNGRYTLLLNSDYKKGNAKVGLDLEVFDSHTGKTRPCSTLSGGETFMTSISLALGLADSIQSTSGGIQLDAIFIDEGFGTLDEETRELSLNILDEIRGQRTVGIISHVTELQNRISSVIHVEKTNTGSHIRIE